MKIILSKEHKNPMVGEKVYTINPVGGRTDIFEVYIYTVLEEPDCHITCKENRLEEIMSDLKSKGYKRVLT